MAMQTQKGNLLLARARAPATGIEPEPRALDYSSVYRFRTKTGNWQGWIGSKGFFASTNWLDFRACGLSQEISILVPIGIDQATGSMLIG